MTPKGATMFWYIGAAVVVVAAVAGVRLLVRRRDSDRDLAEIVLTALGQDWSSRFGTDQAALRRALVENDEPNLLNRIESEVGVVDIKLTRPAGDHHTITAAVLCDYPAVREQAKVTLSLDWIDAPADVRAEFLRTGGSEVFRKWTAATVAAGR